MSEDQRLVILVNDRVKMSRGKYAAQAVHAALMARDAHHGGPVIVLGGRPAEIEKCEVQVHDAGRTEVEPGTLTAGVSEMPSSPNLIGPLTAEEWCSLRVGTDDDPFYCCGDTSDLRDAAFLTLRMGATPVSVGTEFHAAWLHMEASHPDHTLTEHPVVGKLYDFYIKGRRPPPSDEELDAWIAGHTAQKEGS